MNTTLSFPDRIDSLGESAFDIASPRESTRWLRKSVKIKIEYAPASLAGAIDSGIEIVKKNILHHDPDAELLFRRHLGDMGRKMSDRAWHRWVFIATTRRLLMAGIRTIADYDRLEPGTRQAIEVEMDAQLKAEIIQEGNLPRRDPSKGPPAPETDLSDLLAKAEKQLDDDVPQYKRYIQHLRAYAYSHTEFEAHLFRVMAVMKDDRSTRASYGLHD